MFRLRPGLVKSIETRQEDLEEARVMVEGREARAVNYPDLTGKLQPGDRVILNTTAVYLGLGTGGQHFVYFNYRYPEKDLPGPGHIMKLRYTPYQLKVFSCEEPGNPGHQKVQGYTGLGRMPVLVGELHSMLAPAAAVLNYLCPGIRLVYLMTDGAALPLAFSQSVRHLKKAGLITATVTVGHAFGGDLEAVNVYSGLLAAREIAGAQAVICSMGPGNVGTATGYGFTGLEQGEIINAVNILQGRPVFILRLGFKDPRPRHRGISHHSLTVLGKIALTPAEVCLPRLGKQGGAFIMRQLKEHGIFKRHRVMQGEGKVVGEALKRFGLEVKTMGRSPREEPAFFLAAGAAAARAAAIIKGSPGKT